MNPSTAILRELIISLTHLQLPSQTAVLLSHDGPRLGKKALEYNVSAPYNWQQLSRQMSGFAFPPQYLTYLARVQEFLPAACACTSLDIRLLLRATNANLAGNLAFALSVVHTPFILKVEHDHLFTRPIDAISVVRDMIADTRLKYVRFNRRENVMLRCDRGDYYRSSPPDQLLAQGLFGPHSPPNGTELRNQYTRTSCFSDMNHLTSTEYYRTMILPWMLRADLGYPKIPPETLVQDHTWIARNHTIYGTYIYGGVSAPPTIAHVDAAMHGVGEIVPQVRVWMAGVKARIRNGTDEGPFRCGAPLDLRPPRGMSVADTANRRRERAEPRAKKRAGAPATTSGGNAQ